MEQHQRHHRRRKPWWRRWLHHLKKQFKALPPIFLISIGGVILVFAGVVARFKPPETDNEFIMFSLTGLLILGGGILLKKGLHK